MGDFKAGTMARAGRFVNLTDIKSFPEGSNLISLNGLHSWSWTGKVRRIRQVTPGSGKLVPESRS
jgi:hypothetical protein